MDPVKGPVAEFAHELRKLRRDAGHPTYRALTATTHYSHSTLADAARGTRLPTLEVTRAFVRACGGDEQEWARRWATVAHQLEHGSGPGAVAASSSDLRAAPPPLTPLAAPAARWRPARWRRDRGIVPAAVARVLAAASVEGPQTAPEAPAPTTDTNPAEQPRGVTSSRRPVLLTWVRLTGITTLASGLLVLGWTTAPTTQVTTPTNLVDGLEPTQAGCNTNSAIMRNRSVSVPAASHVGKLELLQGSTICAAAAWAQFIPNRNLPPTALITVQIRRPRDGKTLSVAYPNTGHTVHGNILRLDHGCLIASVFLDQPTMRLASESTECLP